MNATKHLLDWNDYLKTGIDIVDQQHRGLVDLANETAAKLSSGDGLSVDEMRTLLGFLTDYAATHFSTEEALMALSGIDEEHVVHHRQSHANFLNQVNTMVDELGGGELTGEQLMEFLGNWLIYHMLGEDQRLSRLLRNEPAGAAETGARAPPSCRRCPRRRPPTARWPSSMPSWPSATSNCRLPNRPSARAATR
ncbi:bacteriohemerythrin [Dechloromonas sp. A34]|uniref:bacteriohemerythrin n=1 Tax=Dechloromonas sp. A34 TaxID=447588 RepID=UPI00224885F5|nr:hemerythrin family protein [Dechloromonas sp. A34]